MATIAVLLFPVLFLLAVLPRLVQAGTLSVRVEMAAPLWDNGQVIASNMLEIVYVRLYGGKQGAPMTLLDAVKWAPVVTFRRPDSTSTATNCYASTFAVDRDGDGKIGTNDLEGPLSDVDASSCGTFKDAAIVLKPGKPVPAAVISPAPPQ